jgi:hypothetical protein
MERALIMTCLMESNFGGFHFSLWMTRTTHPPCGPTATAGLATV